MARHDGDQPPVSDIDTWRAFEQSIKDSDPALYAGFEERYEDPTFLGSDCVRCGASVSVFKRETHKAWHRNMSLGMWVLGSSMKGVYELFKDDDGG